MEHSVSSRFMQSAASAGTAGTAGTGTGIRTGTRIVKTFMNREG